MLEATFSPLMPTDTSEQFYTDFYNQYCFIQVNDIFISQLKSCLSEDDAVELLQTLSGFREDQEIAAVYSIGAGLMNPALMRRRKEHRGLSIEIFRQLELEHKDPLEWYSTASEFLMLYAICEQALKEYLTANGKEAINITERKILHSLFDVLDTNGSKKTFLSELKEATSEVITSQNELLFAWRYYTYFRNSLAHAGGRTTNRIKGEMHDLLENSQKEIESIQEALLPEFSEDEAFFTSPFDTKTSSITEKQLNFFRNMTVAMIESLERTLHPDEYKIPDFDPYKW